MVHLASVYSVLGSLAETVLQFLHGLGLGWGLAIISATFLVRILISPFVWKQLRTGYLLRALNPEVKKIQNYYDTDFEKMNKATMDLYTANKFHIFGILIPSLLQAPFLISIFVYLNSADFKKDVGADQSFLFIENMLEPTSSHWPTMLALVAIYLSIQILSTLVNSKFKLQGKGLVASIVLSFVFTLFLLHFPSALMLYWTSSSAFLFVQQVVMRLLIKEPPIVSWQEPEENQPRDSISQHKNTHDE